MFTWTNYFLQHAFTDLLQAAAGVAGILHGAEIQPYIAPHVPLPTSALADFTVSIDANLAPTATVWGAPYSQAGGGVGIDGSAQLWQLASGANACIVYGFLCLDSGGTNLLGAESLDTPINLPNTLAGVTYVPQVVLGVGFMGAGTVIV